MYFSIVPLKWPVIILLFLFQCKSVEPSHNQDKALQKVISENIGADYQSTQNESKTFALCVQNIAAIKIGKLYTNFIVIELSNNQIVEKGKYLNGHCIWLDDFSIEVVDMPGTIKENQSSDFKKIISIKRPKL